MLVPNEGKPVAMTTNGRGDVRLSRCGSSVPVWAKPRYDGHFSAGITCFPYASMNAGWVRATLWM